MSVIRPKYRIAVAIQLGFMRLTGSRLDEVNVVPRGLLKIDGEQFGETPPNIASLRSIIHAREHASRTPGVSDAAAWGPVPLQATRPLLLAAMREANQTVASIDRLVAKARQWAFEKQLLVLAERTLHDICARAASDTEISVYHTICAAVTPDQRRAGKEALCQKHKMDTRT